MKADKNKNALLKFISVMKLLPALSKENPWTQSLIKKVYDVKN